MAIDVAAAAGSAGLLSVGILVLLFSTGGIFLLLSSSLAVSSLFVIVLLPLPLVAFSFDALICGDDDEEEVED